MFGLFKKLNSKGEWRKVSQLAVGMEIAVPKNGLIDQHQMGSLEARANIADDDIMWDEIVSIEHVGEERVYDIEVEEIHNFVGNNIFAHNTLISGNVGIGTTGPGAKLDVSTAAGSNPTFQLADGDVAHGMTATLPTSALFRIQNYSSAGGGAWTIGASDD